MLGTVLSTTVVQSWAGADLLQIGPIYPFVGSEPFLYLVGLVFWLWFHVTQFRIEARELKDDGNEAADAGVLTRVFAEQARG